MYQRQVTVLVYLSFMLLGLLSILWGILLPDIMAQLQMSPAASGLFFACLSLGSITGAFLGGKYVQKFEFVPLFAVLLLILVVLIIGASLVQFWPLLLFFVFTLGLTCSGLFTIGHTLIARLYVEKRARMMGFMDFMFSLGTLAAPLYVVVLYWGVEDWRWPLRILAVFLAGTAAFAWYLGRTHQSPAHMTHAKGSLSYRQVMKKPVFFALALMMFGYGAVEWGHGNWFVTYASQGLALSTEQSRLIFAFFTAGMVLSRLSFSLFLRWFTSAQLLMILVTCAFFGAVLVKITAVPALLQLGNFALGLGLGAIFPLMLTAAMDLDSDNGPVLSGLANIGGSIGYQAAALGTGLAAQQVGIATAYWLIPILAVWLFGTVSYFSYLLHKKHTKSVQI